MYSVQDLHKGGVSPFGNLRINDRSHLPAAYRSVPRPSSPLGAKASTERPLFTQHPATRTQNQHASQTCQSARKQQGKNTHSKTASPKARRNTLQPSSILKEHRSSRSAKASRNRPSGSIPTQHTPHPTTPRRHRRTARWKQHREWRAEPSDRLVA